MTTEEKINQLEAAFKAQIDELRKEVKPKFEVGKWYTYNDASHIFNITEIKNDKIYGYGHSPISGWTNVTEWYDSKRIIPATDKEVEEALIKEAERRGFKEGVKFKDMYSEIELRNGVFLYNCSDYGTCLIDNSKSSGNYIFWGGKWAEIIKDEPIKVGGYEVKKDSHFFRIGCKTVSYNRLESLRMIMRLNKFKKVAFDGIEVNLETIEKILKM